MNFNDYIKDEPFIANIKADINIDDNCIEGIKQYYKYWEDKLQEVKDEYTNYMQTK